jgi:hypothetical protein
MIKIAARPTRIRINISWKLIFFIFLSGRSAPFWSPSSGLAGHARR